jgi:GNAT superfamily N-acetyltransferase
MEALESWRGKKEDSMTEDFTLRGATPDDIGIVMHHRRSMFCDMGHRDGRELAAMIATSEPLFLTGLTTGSYRGWFFAAPSGTVVAGGGIILLDYHSSPTDPLAKRPFIVNMYTEPEYRRRGLARRLMGTMIDWCREEGFGGVLLHASDEGRPLYESLGFEPTNEMHLKLR